MYSDQSIGSSSVGSSASLFASSSGESSFARSSLSVTSSTSSSSGFCMISCFRICWSSSVGTCRSFNACCSRCVMISAGFCDRCSEGFISMGTRSRSQCEAFAEVDLTRLWVARELFGRPLQQDPSLVHDVGAIGDPECLAHVVVGDQYPEPALAQTRHDVLDL